MNAADLLIKDSQNLENYKESNLEILQLIFPDIDWSNPDINSQGEVQVISPFPRSYDSNGNPIFEEHPSASINIDKGVFYDFALNDNVNLPSGNNGCTLQELFKLVHAIPRQSDANLLLDYLVRIDNKVHN